MLILYVATIIIPVFPRIIHIVHRITRYNNDIKCGALNVVWFSIFDRLFRIRFEWNLGPIRSEWQNWKYKGKVRPGLNMRTYIFITAIAFTQCTHVNDIYAFIYIYICIIALYWEYLKWNLKSIFAGPCFNSCANTRYFLLGSTSNAIVQ